MAQLLNCELNRPDESASLRDDLKKEREDRQKDIDDLKAERDALKVHGVVYSGREGRGGQTGHYLSLF